MSDWIKWFLSVLENVAVKGLVVGSINHPVAQYKGAVHHSAQYKGAACPSAKCKRCRAPVCQV